MSWFAFPSLSFAFAFFFLLQIAEGIGRVCKKEKDRERLKIMTNLNDPNNFNYTLGVYFEVQ